MTLRMIGFTNRHWQLLCANRVDMLVTTLTGWNKLIKD